MAESITFTFRGTQYTLTRAQVVASVDGVTPSGKGSHVAKISGSWYPVNQAFSLAIGVARADCQLLVSRDKLSQLGFELGER